jgi:protoporphyrinogen oxidase
MENRVSERVRTHYLVVGAGVSGLSFCNFARGGDYLIVEADSEPGGYCKTVVQDGFVWDYSGHFFHFKDPDIERYLLDRMPADEVRSIQKSSQIVFKGGRVDFPFQKNIHQLPQADFIECLHDLYFKDEGIAPGSRPAHFEEMLYRKFGRGIAERFLIPYNEKLYACSLKTLDVDAMGRFFPYAETRDIIRNFRQADNRSYNDRFTYPRGGAIQYVRALLHDLDPTRISYGERVVSIDMRAKVARTNLREIEFEYLVSSAPFDRLAQMTAVPVEAPLSWNKVLIFNLGFDAKGWQGVHWVYFPEREVSFYRVGFYDNIFETDRMSLYVEIGLAADAPVDVAAARARVLEDLSMVGIVTTQRLVSEHTITLDPAYVHITRESIDTVSKARAVLAARGIYSVGRYGGWTYCSIEDNIIESRSLARTLSRASGVAGV